MLSFGSTKSQKILIGIIILFIFCLLVFLFLSLSKKTSNPASTNESSSAYVGWKEYKADIFSLKYPGQWNAVRNDTRDVKKLYLYPKSALGSDPIPKIALRWTPSLHVSEEITAHTLLKNEYRHENSCSISTTSCALFLGKYKVSNGYVVQDMVALATYKGTTYMVEHEYFSSDRNVEEEKLLQKVLRSIFFY